MSVCAYCSFNRPEEPQIISNRKNVKVISPIDYISYDPEEDSDIFKDEQYQTYEEAENFVEYIDSKEIFYNKHTQMIYWMTLSMAFKLTVL